MDDNKGHWALPVKGASAPRLTRRELDILILACAGKTDKQIADDLGISSGSVRTYWERMRVKCKAVNRMHILALLTGADRILRAKFNLDQPEPDGQLTLQASAAPGKPSGSSHLVTRRSYVSRKGKGASASLESA